MFGEPLSEATKQKISAAFKGKKNPNWKGGKVKRICNICGKEFERSPNHMNGKNYGLYCSKSCAMKARTGENAAAWRGGQVECICETCGKPFKKDPAVIKMGHGRFCSPHCAGKGKKGPNNPAWNGGISYAPYCHKFNYKFKEYIRDKFDNVCFLCGKTEAENGKRLSVHHVNYDKHCGCAETEEDRKVDDKSCQFVPLCISCNSKVNNDRDKWEKYFKNKLRNKLNGWYI